LKAQTLPGAILAAATIFGFGPVASATTPPSDPKPVDEVLNGCVSGPINAPCEGSTTIPGSNQGPTTTFVPGGPTTTSGTAGNVTITFELADGPFVLGCTEIVYPQALINLRPDDNFTEESVCGEGFEAFFAELVAAHPQGFQQLASAQIPGEFGDVQQYLVEDISMIGFQTCISQEITEPPDDPFTEIVGIITSVYPEATEADVREVWNKAAELLCPQLFTGTQPIPSTTSSPPVIPSTTLPPATTTLPPVTNVTVQITTGQGTFTLNCSEIAFPPIFDTVQGDQNDETTGCTPQQEAFFASLVQSNPTGFQTFVNADQADIGVFNSPDISIENTAVVGFWACFGTSVLGWDVMVFTQTLQPYYATVASSMDFNAAYYAAFKHICPSVTP
jgi:hypothetical protein